MDRAMDHAAGFTNRHLWAGWGGEKMKSKGIRVAAHGTFLVSGGDTCFATAAPFRGVSIYRWGCPRLLVVKVRRLPRA
jgi:hypothetical protein